MCTEEISHFQEVANVWTKGQEWGQDLQTPHGSPSYQ